MVWVFGGLEKAGRFDAVVDKVVMAWSCGVVGGSWFMPVLVLVRRRDAFFGGSELLGAIICFYGVYLPFSLLLRLFCVLVYLFYLRLRCHCSVWGSRHAMGADQLLWVCTDSGGPTEVVLVVNLCWYACQGGLGVWTSRHSLCYRLSANSLIFYVFLVFLFSCLICPSGTYMSGFSCLICPSGAYLRGLRLSGFCSDCLALCPLSVNERWHSFVKWLLPPSARMKCRVLKLFYDFIWRHEEVGLLNNLLCLCVGYISSVDSCYFKTVRVASGALSVFRR